MVSSPSTATRWVDRIAASTPPDRDRVVDGLRALAICGVILGHWLVAVQAPGSDGGLHNASPLRELPYLAPLSWVLQMLGLFFLVGGYTGALGWARARERGVSYGAWLGARTRRLGRPVLAVTAAWGCALPLLALAGVPAATLRTCVVLVVQPLWFIGVYLVATALTPLVLALDRRLGRAAPLPAAALVAIVDALRYGPWADAMPGWLGLVNVIPGWLFAYQLGIGWARGWLDRRTAAVLAAAGAALFAVLLLRFGYPASMVGVPGAARTNSNPPSLLVVALAAAQCGLAVLLRDRLAALLRRPLAWAAVVPLNLAAMTVFCWHLTAVLLVSLTTYALGGPVHGLHDTTGGPAWLPQRLIWLPVFAAILLGLWALVRRFESPWPPGHRVATTLAVAASAGFAAYTVAVF